MKPSLKIAKALTRLIDENEMPITRFSSNKSVIDELKSRGVISIDSKGRGHVVSRGEFFQSYIDQHYNGELSAFLSAESRGELASVYGDDKARSIGPQKGLFLWSGIPLQLTGSTVINNEEGVITFIHDRIDIEIPAGVTIVGVENFESLTYGAFLNSRFNLPKNCLFAYRNPSFSNLIKNVQRDVLYIPDYDIFGVRIFETEILKNNPLARLYIPEDIEDVLSEINTSRRYLEQSHMKGSKYVAVTDDGKHVAELIRKYKKIIPQEYFHYIRAKDQSG